MSVSRAILAAVFVVALAGCAAVPPGTRSESPTPKGFKQRPPRDVAAIRAGLAVIVETALSPGQWARAGGYLVAQDRERVVPDLPAGRAAVDAAVDQLRKAFVTRFGRPLRVSAATFATDADVLQAEVDDERDARRHWPVPAFAALRHGVDLSAPRVDSDPRLTPGRDIAVVRFAGGVSLAVSMQYEATGYWLVDVPNDLDGPALTAALVARLDGLEASADRWPQDPDAAARRIAEAVLAALYGG